jgi:hypothetical protein
MQNARNNRDKRASPPSDKQKKTPEPQKSKESLEEDDVEEASIESFPASDAPSSHQSESSDD